jgi:hypothetical protein
MASKQPTELERLARLVDEKLSDMERRAKAGELPSVSELNGARRLALWLEGERQIEVARELTTS